MKLATKVDEPYSHSTKDYEATVQAHESAAHMHEDAVVCLVGFPHVTWTVLARAGSRGHDLIQS